MTDSDPHAAAPADPPVNDTPLATPVRRRNVVLITDDRISNAPDGLTARWASTRLRLLVALDALNAHGHRAVVLAHTTPENIQASRPFAEADHVVIGKVLQDYRALAARARQLGKTVTLDVTDDLARFKPLAPMHALIEHADSVTAPSDGLLALARTWVDRPLSAHRIDDPLRDPLRPPRGDLRRRPLRLIWFGSPTNAHYLNPHLPGLAALAERHPLELCLVSTGLALFQDLLDRHPWSEPGPFRIRFTEWSVAAQERELEHSDLVLLPGDSSSDSALKSANRLISAIAAGRFCVASPLPAHREFASHALLADDLAAGIDAATAIRPASVIDSLRTGQAFIAEAYSLTRIGRRWVEVLTGLNPPATEP